MLAKSVGIFSPASLGGGQYSFNLYFQVSGDARFLRTGDYVKDSTNNEYEVLSWAIQPSDFASGGLVTVQFITTDVLPHADTGFNSSCATPGQLNMRPAVKTPGVLYSINSYSGQNYEYRLMGSWTQGAQAALAIVGDRIVDGTGKEYEITFIDPAQRFLTFFRMKEVESEGQSPASGSATLYRPTAHFNFFQGSEITDPARNMINIRDNVLVDQLLDESIDAVLIELKNETGSLVEAHKIVCSSAGSIGFVDVSDEAKIHAIAGITLESIKNNYFGKIVSHGLIEEVEIAGDFDDVVFISKTGTFTSTKPSLGEAGFLEGDWIVSIGTILRNKVDPLKKDLLVRIEIKGQL